MRTVVYEQTRRRFGEAAEHYARGALFAEGEDLAWLVEAATPQPGEIALDIGTAAGHTAFALAPYLGFVIGLDITPAMIDKARQLAGERGITNFDAVIANGEELPFPEAAFDLVSCRYSAHHFFHPKKVMWEIGRALRPGGRLVIIDNSSPDDPSLDRWINAADKLRDPSHVRQWNQAEWVQLFSSADLSFENVRTWFHELDFQSWVERQQVPPAQVRELEAIFAAAGPEIRAGFAIRDGYFSLLTRLMRGVKPAG